MSSSPGSSGRLGPQERPLRARRAAAATPLGPAERERAGSPGAAGGVGREAPARPSPTAGRPSPHLRQRDLPLHPTAPGAAGDGGSGGGRPEARRDEPRVRAACGTGAHLLPPAPPLPRKPSGTSARHRFPFRGAPRRAPAPLSVSPRASRLQDGERGRGRPTGGGGRKRAAPSSKMVAVPGTLSGALRRAVWRLGSRRWAGPRVRGRPLARRFRRARGVVGDPRALLLRGGAEKREP